MIPRPAKHATGVEEPLRERNPRSRAAADNAVGVGDCATSARRHRRRRRCSTGKIGKLVAKSAYAHVDIDGEVLPAVAAAYDEDRSTVGRHVLVSVNGRTAAVVRTFAGRRGVWVVAPFPPWFLVDGANQLELYELERRGRGWIVHPVRTSR